MIPTDGMIVVRMVSDLSLGVCSSWEWAQCRGRSAAESSTAPLELRDIASGEELTAEYDLDGERPGDDSVRTGKGKKKGR